MNRLVLVVGVLLLAGGAATVTAGGSSARGAVAKASHHVRLGRTVLLARRSRTRGCTLGALPDRRCSPGAYYSRLTRAVICSPHFHTSVVRSLSLSQKYAVEREYGLPKGRYGHALEIDHIVPLRLGGSNRIANLYPEEAAFANGSPGFHVKDRLDARVQVKVCTRRISLWSARRQIAANWEKLYRRVFGVPARKH